MVLAISRNPFAAVDPWITSAKKVFAIHPEDILVLHNDLDLKETDAELQFVSSDRRVGGHRGVDLIREKVGSFYRLRVGIGRPDSSQKIPDYLMQTVPLPRNPKFLPLINYWLEERAGSLQLDTQRTYRAHFLDYVSEETVRELEHQSIFNGFYEESHRDLREVFLRLVEGTGIETMADILALTPNDRDWGTTQLTESQRDITRRWLVLLRAHLHEREQLPLNVRPGLFTPAPRKAP